MRRRTSFRDLGRAALAAGLVALLATAHPAVAEDRGDIVQVRPDEVAPAFRSPSPVRPQRGGSAPRPTSSEAGPARPGFVVGVFGDALGAALAAGLAERYADVPATGVVDATRDASALSPEAGWDKIIDEATARRGALDVAAVMVGGADAATDAPDWRITTAARLDRVAAVFRDRHIPLVWVGLPIVRDGSRASRFADLNGIVRDVATRTGGRFVDSWDGFSDDNGDYSPAGPDVNGQDARLRRNDGVGFTRAGALKLASFVDTELKPDRDRAAASRRLVAMSIDNPDVFDEALQIDINVQIRKEAGLPGIAPPREGPIALLTAPALARDGVLATAIDPARLNPALATGATPPSRAGRIDDFSWPRPAMR